MTRLKTVAWCSLKTAVAGFVVWSAAAEGQAAPPVVTGVTASQRGGGSKLVDIYYNLSDPDSNLIYVSVKISNDGGSLWGIIPRTLSGNVGANQTPGNGKHIVWDAGADVPGLSGTQYRAMVTVNDANVAYSGDMVFIPAGSFLMGTPGSGGNESPQHSVHLDGYWLGRKEVTRGEYRQFIEAGGYQSPSYWTGAGWAWRAQNNRTQPVYWADTQTWNGNTFTQSDQHPVVGVSYYEAEAFCKWAGGRLPTEAEWEKAARWDGAASRAYPWGNEWNPGFCNNWDDTSILGGGYSKYQTAPVTSYPQGKSPYGLHDMAGNVWEWCSDWYGNTYYSQTPAGGWVNPKGPSSGIYRLLRGGSFPNGSSYCRAAYRSGNDPYGANNDDGFRVAR